MKTELELKANAPDLVLNFDWYGQQITIEFRGYMKAPLGFIQELQRRWNAGEKT